MPRTPYIPPGGPPRVEPPSSAVCAAMGEAAIFAMLEEVYDEFAASPLLRGMFPQEPDALRVAAHKSGAFFVGILGGPPLYHQRHGNPAMRARHMPFPIDEAARQEWLRCFFHVLDHAPERYGFPPEHLPGFRAFLKGFSAWMVNTAPPDAPTAAQGSRDVGIDIFAA
jgi:hemoglobin